MLELISSTKLRNNIEEAPFDIPGASTEHKKKLMFKHIFEGKMCFCWKWTGTLVTKLIRYCK